MSYCTNCKETGSLTIQTLMNMRVRELMEAGQFDMSLPSRVKKLREEAEEFEDAVNRDDIPHAAREAADVMVVMWSALLEMGYNPLGVMCEVVDARILRLRCEQALKEDRK